MTKREIVNLRKYKQVVAIVIIWAIRNSTVDVVVAPVVVGGMLERVAPLEGQTAREALLDGSLQGVVVIVGIVSEIVDTLRPAVLAKERSAVVLRYSGCKANDCWFIGAVGRSAARKLVRTLVTYVG